MTRSKHSLRRINKMVCSEAIITYINLTQCQSLLCQCSHFYWNAVSFAPKTSSQTYLMNIKQGKIPYQILLLTIILLFHKTCSTILLARQSTQDVWILIMTDQNSILNINSGIIQTCTNNGLNSNHILSLLLLFVILSRSFKYNYIQCSLHLLFHN